MTETTVTETITRPIMTTRPKPVGPSKRPVKKKVVKKIVKKTTSKPKTNAERELPSTTMQSNINPNRESFENLPFGSQPKSDTGFILSPRQDWVRFRALKQSLQITTTSEPETTTWREQNFDAERNFGEAQQKFPPGHACAAGTVLGTYKEQSVVSGTLTFLIASDQIRARIYVREK